MSIAINEIAYVFPIVWTAGSTFAMSHAILPLAIILNIVVCVVQDALAIGFVIIELAFVSFVVWKVLDTLALLHVIHELAFIQLDVLVIA